jgi:murein DD-endopeptidase MepM/ murein hydrolase activator NlpD
MAKRRKVWYHRKKGFMLGFCAFSTRWYFPMQQLVKQLPSRHRLLILLVSVLLAILLLMPSEQASASRNTERPATEVVTSLNVAAIDNFVSDELRDTVAAEGSDATASSASINTAAVSPEEELPPVSSEPDLNWVTVSVQSGDILSGLFRKAGVSQQTMQQILDLGRQTRTLTRLFPGEQIEFGLNENGELQQLRYAINRLETLEVTRQSDGRFNAMTNKKMVELQQQFAAGEIRSSFWHAGLAAGLAESQIMQLAGVFGWDIDFALDLRAGDSFAVLLNAEYLEGEPLGNGTILAAEFTNQGQVYQAILHSDGNYYKPDGQSMRQAFLRAPVSFQYVSSNFNPRRLHPVLGTVRAHNGTDYVAPVGTPILAAGDGRVTHSAFNNVNGHYVFIQHANNVVTKYLHLSRRDVKVGQRVKQGQSIGRLGATGRVTGAHLHYEFIVAGVHRNPRTVKLPQATPLSGQQKQQFSVAASTLLSALQQQQQQYLAARQNQTDSEQAAP